MNNKTIDISNGVVTMLCYRKSANKEFKVYFDLDFMEKVNGFDEWTVEKNNDKVYAIKFKTTNIYLHRLIFGDCDGKKVFAYNNDYFDCRSENLYLKSKN